MVVIAALGQEPTKVSQVPRHLRNPFRHSYLARSRQLERRRAESLATLLPGLGPGRVAHNREHQGSYQPRRSRTALPRSLVGAVLPRIGFDNSCCAWIPLHGSPLMRMGKIEEANFAIGLMLDVPFGFVVGSVIGEVVAALGLRSAGTAQIGRLRACTRDALDQRVNEPSDAIDAGWHRWTERFARHIRLDPGVGTGCRAATHGLVAAPLRRIYSTEDFQCTR